METLGFYNNDGSIITNSSRKKDILKLIYATTNYTGETYHFVGMDGSSCYLDCIDDPAKHYRSFPFERISGATRSIKEAKLCKREKYRQTQHCTVLHGLNGTVDFTNTDIFCRDYKNKVNDDMITKEIDARDLAVKKIRYQKWLYSDDHKEIEEKKEELDHSQTLGNTESSSYDVLNCSNVSLGINFHTKMQSDHENQNLIDIKKKSRLLRKPLRMDIHGEVGEYGYIDLDVQSMDSDIYEELLQSGVPEEESFNDEDLGIAPHTALFRKWKMSHLSKDVADIEEDMEALNRDQASSSDDDDDDPSIIRGITETDFGS